MHFCRILVIMTAVFLCSLSTGWAQEELRESYTLTIWPLLDYRETAKGDLKRLSLLGPLFKFQQQGDDRDIVLRPLFYRSEHPRSSSAETDVLYPLASRDSSPEYTTTQILKLYQSSERVGKTANENQHGSMFFPFYISGTSEKYGPYYSVFPLYGDIYERFWRDEYHYVLFPLYSRTVKKGRTSTNILYPFFSLISGEQESGFQFWPLFGHSSKEGVYQSSFFLWPIFSYGKAKLDTERPEEELMIFPLYTSTQSSVLDKRYVLWPFFGHVNDLVKKEEEWDILWPLGKTTRGEKHNENRFLPFYMEERTQETSKRWVLWPLYRHDEIHSEPLELQRDRILYFLYTDTRETSPKLGTEKRKVAFWPLFFYRSESDGFSRFTFPAPVEPILDRDGIERSWAPLWRIYQHTWNEKGDSAISFLWNFYWKERSGQDMAYEFFPLVLYRTEQGAVDFKLLKGFIRFTERVGRKKLTFLWLPFGFSWDDAVTAPGPQPGSNL